jgi:regulator of PEP synthase PpsR (kinase-PPPase family)
MYLRGMNCQGEPMLEEPVELFVDKEKMGQVIKNLLSNAAKYSPDGGLIRQKRLNYLGQTDYTDLESIKRELKHSHRIFRDIQGLKVLDVTNKSIEEIANEIMEREPY